VNAPFDALFGGSVPAQTALIGTCPARSGIEGTVTSGPITPVCQQGVPCEQPYQAMLLVTDSDGIEVARTTSNLNGTYRIGLLPGTYTVVPQPGGEIFPIASPVSVTVPGGEYVTLDVSYDTGIR
jgi:hypothetical protein